MVPHVFVSSTILDLRHLRDAIRETILELGYTPVMSEHGDVGYLPTASAQDSCYLALKQCQLAVFIISKRYSSPAADGYSVTHNEFGTAREQGIPAIFLVDQEVLSYRHVFEVNPGTVAFPGMDSPARTFQFLQEILQSKVNNGILPFSHVGDARAQLRAQIAHIVGDMLRRRGDPIAGEVKDILSEIKTLRHSLTEAVNMDDAQRFMRAVRFLLEEEHQYLRQVVEYAAGSLEEGVPILLKSSSFADCVRQATGHEPGVMEFAGAGEVRSFLDESSGQFSASHFGVTDSPEGRQLTSFFALRHPQRGVVLNLRALNNFEETYRSLIEATRKGGAAPVPGA